MNLLDDVHNIDNHRVLVYLALELTRDSPHPVLEMGLSCELSAARQALHESCEVEKRHLVSVDEDLLACAAARHLNSPHHEVRCCAWDVFPIESGLWSVASINHAPGERRRFDALRLKDRCQVIVIHDTEPSADHGYKFSEIWGEFRWRVDVKTPASCWASAVSNSLDLSIWRGVKLAGYVVSLPEDDATAGDDKFQKFLDDAAEGWERNRT